MFPLQRKFRRAANISLLTLPTPNRFLGLQCRHEAHLYCHLPHGLSCICGAWLTCSCRRRAQNAAPKLFRHKFTMLSGQSLLVAAQVVALGTVFPLFPSHPFSVWSSAYDTAVLSIPLQQWRSLGRYYMYTDRKHSW